MHLMHTNRASQYLAGCVQTVVHAVQLQSTWSQICRGLSAAAYAKPCARTQVAEHSFRFSGPAASKTFL